MKSTFCAMATGLALTVAAPVMAEDVTLTFTFVTRNLEQTVIPAPAGFDLTMSVAKAAGTAMFDDGRIADKQYTWVGEQTKTSGEFRGNSTYTFENGDSISLSFTGGWGADGLGGDYTVVSGTGGFEGVTGTGRFDATGDPWEDATLYKGSWSLSMPES